jgi:hypothetical protein
MATTVNPLELLKFDSAVLAFVSDFLTLKDCVVLPKVCKRFHQLLRLELDEKKAPDYHGYGEQVNDPIREYAQIYRYSNEDRNASIGRITFTFSWRDQCWGPIPRKGTIWIKLTEMTSKSHPSSILRMRHKMGTEMPFGNLRMNLLL